MLSVKLLGMPRVYLHEQSLSSQITGKELALLVYLIVTGRAHTRDALAALLWRDMPDSQARKNLRDILPALREKIGSYLDISRQDIAFNRESPYWLDVEAFRISLTSDALKTDHQLLQSAVDLYNGDFLEGFHVRNALAFEEWMEAQRTQLHNLAIGGMYKLSSQYIQQKQFSNGLTLSKRLLSLAPWHEEAHRHYMILLAKSGQRSSALAHFAVCEHALLNELDVPPSPETVRLYEMIKAGDFDGQDPEIELSSIAQMQPHSVINLQSVQAASFSCDESTKQITSPLAPNNLETPLTPLVGRKNELAYLQQCLANPTCRLVTIWGLGGVGKTRLALEFAHQIVEQSVNAGSDTQSSTFSFKDGVYFVSLAHLPRSTEREEQENPSAKFSLILAAIAEVLNERLEDAAKIQLEQKRTLFTHLKGKQILLVLDNFEHLSDHATSVNELLRQVPQLKVIVTSRQRLNLQAEWLLRLEGLSQIDGDNENWHESAAVNLFLQRAQQMLPNFTVNPSNIVSVRRICQLVEGLPLAIELAAHWLYVLDCKTIADEIAQNPDFLASTFQDLPERQRTLFASLDYSWHLLTSSEKHALVQLIRASSFKDNKHEAMLRVYEDGKHRGKSLPLLPEHEAELPQISLPTLSALINKSFLRPVDKELYKMHQLVRQYCEVQGKLPSM
ncbi:MAG: BTAD domain-containing putative transcriptional regulator [Caldilineaceae bacterium]